MPPMAPTLHACLSYPPIYLVPFALQTRPQQLHLSRGGPKRRPLYHLGNWQAGANEPGAGTTINGGYRRPNGIGSHRISPLQDHPNAIRNTVPMAAAFLTSRRQVQEVPLTSQEVTARFGPTDLEQICV